MDICERTTFSKGGFDRHPWESARIKVVKNMLKEIVKQKPDTHILDLGCGDAYVAQQLSNTFSKASFYCVDIAFTSDMIDSISKTVKENPITLYSSLHSFKEKNQRKVDVVLLLDVIEHIEDEISFLQGLANSGVIDENTKIIISVPAFQFLFSNHDIYLKHFRRYNVELLNKHLNKAGFESIKVGYFFFTLLLIRVIQKIFRQNRSVDKEKGIGAYQSKGVYDRVVVKVLYLDFLIGKFFRLFRIRIPGLSCFSICQIQRS